MSFNRNSNLKTLIVSSLVIPFALAGCGTDDDTFVQKDSKRTVEQTTTTSDPVPAPVETTTSAPQPVVEVTYEIAERSFLDGRYEEAVDLFSRYTEKEPNNAWGYYMLGLSAWKDGRLDVAESAFNQSLTIDPNHLKSCINLSRVLLESERSALALTVLDRALAIDSTSSTAHRLKGNAYSGLNQVDDAVDSYKKAIALDPKDAWSMNNLAFLWIQQNRYDDALPALARAVELRKDVSVFYNNLGMALEHDGHYVDAADAYEFAESLDPKNERAALNRDRVAGVREDESVLPVDLTALARTFESTIETWKLATTTESKPDSVVSVQPQ